MSEPNIYQQAPPLADLGLRLSAVVRGQVRVISILTNAIERKVRKLAPPRGCRGAFLFVGPTGVGKTETARALAQVLYGGQMVRIDASEFANSQCTEIALGDGRTAAGRFAAAYDVAPSGVWLFDEIEKGAEQFKDLLIQMTDAGRVTLASGRTLDFSDIYLIATSNLGTREILEREHLPFTSLERHVLQCVERWMRPELLARFDAVLVFRPLDWDSQVEITCKRLDELMAWYLSEHGWVVTYDRALVDHLIAVGFSRRYGARPLIRAIDQAVGDALLPALRAGRTGSGQLVVSGEALLLIPQA